MLTIHRHGNDCLGRIRPLRAWAFAGASLFGLLAVAPAQAGQVLLDSYNGNSAIPDSQRNQSGPGFVQSEASTSAFYGQASSYEFLGGIGVSAFAASRGLNMQARAFASFGQNMTADCGAVSTCTMTFTVLADGTTSANGNANSNNPGAFGTSQSAYNFNWSLNNSSAGVSAGNSATVDQRSQDDGRHTLDITGNPFSTVHNLLVHTGDRLSLFLQAGAGAFTDNNGNGDASAATDFSHTLRWGGVLSLTDLDGAPLDLDLARLLGDDGFNYINAAGPNPYTTPASNGVPEPASWALALGGLALLGRRRAASR